jgi:hypothetical protein
LDPCPSRGATRVSPQANQLVSGAAALQNSDDTGLSDLGVDFVESDRLQMVGNELRCLEFAIAQLRILVELVTPFVMSSQMTGGRFSFYI